MKVPGSAIAIGILLLQATQTPTLPSTPALAGRWRLTTAAPAPDIPAEMLVTGLTRDGHLRLDNSFPDGVVIEMLTVDPTNTETSAVGALVFVPFVPVMRGAAAAHPQRREAWSIDPSGRLHIDITDRRPTGAPVRTELIYTRVAPEPRRGVNLLTNPDALARRTGWSSTGDARVESCDGNPCFVVRNRGSFQQTVLLPADATGQYLVTIGSGASERVDASITGRARLFGRMAVAEGMLFVGILQGPNMRADSPQPNAWVTMSGVYPIPERAARVTLELGQAEARDVPRDGSAARFDDIGLYILETEAAAREFVDRWQGRSN